MSSVGFTEFNGSHRSLVGWHIGRADRSVNDRWPQCGLCGGVCRLHNVLMLVLVCRAAGAVGRAATLGPQPHRRVELQFGFATSISSFGSGDEFHCIIRGDAARSTPIAQAPRTRNFMKSQNHNCSELWHQRPLESSCATIRTSIQSDRDDDFPSRMTLLDIADGGRDVAQWKSPVDHRSDLPRFAEFLQEQQVALVGFY